jgi:hypothetical protein
LTPFLAIFSVAAGAATLYLFAEDMRSRRRFGWKQVEQLVKKLMTDMRSAGYKPDVVVGIGRGGAILAGMLAGNLGYVPLVVLDTEIDHPDGVSQVKFRFPESCPSLKGQSVLIVVGELFTGEDLRKGINFVRRKHPETIRTATLLTHPAASVQPDFVGLKTDKPLSAPWRMTTGYQVGRL